jgi:alpha-N-arabinofuranosidase
MRKPAFVAALLVSMACRPAAEPATPVLSIQADKVRHNLSPILYGLMTEELNYSYEGGLYAELIRNRSFKADAKEPRFWHAVGGAAMALDPATALNGSLDTSLKLEVSRADAPAGVANGGFWGIAVRPRTTYRVSFFAKAKAPFDVAVTVALQSREGGKTFARAEVGGLTGEWKQFETTLTTGDVPVSKDNEFLLTTTTPGTLWLQQVSVFPPTFNARPNGLRPDIMKLLAGLNPKFLRFPGGNYLEGNEIENRFDWKKTIGPVERRPGHDNDAWHYWSTDGMGLLEFLLWCEDLKMEPVLGLYAGYSMKQRVVQPGPDLEPYVRDALDEIEYVTGPVTSTWGARRAADGHPEPFALRFVEVGNEDYADKSGSFEGRFAQFHDAIRKRYPHLKIISSSKVKSRPADVSDELHIYARAQEDMDWWINRLDTWPRTGPKLFSGEWSTRLGAPTPNMAAALGDAGWVLGLENNSDHVIMSAYAPLFANVSQPGPGGSYGWTPNLIGFDALNSYGSPSYHMLAMFSANIGDQVLETSAKNIPTELWQPRPPVKDGVTGPLPPRRPVRKVFFNATRDSRTGALYVKLVNCLAAPQPVRLQISGARTIEPGGTSIVLRGDHPEDTNSIENPHKIVPKTEAISGLKPDFTRVLPPLSITTLKLQCK